MSNYDETRAQMSRSAASHTRSSLHCAIQRLADCWERYDDAAGVAADARALLDLRDAVFDLTTYHPRFNVKTGTVGRPDDVA